VRAILNHYFAQKWFAFIVALISLCGDLLAQNPPRHPLIVGSEEDYPPFAIGKSGGKADGFTVQLWRAVAAEAGLEYTIRVLPFREILDEFKRGEIDVMINLAQSDERRVFSDFSVPHVIVQGAIFVRKDESRIHSEADLSGKSIIVLDADLAHDYAITKGWEPQLVRVKTIAEGLTRLSSGQNDAMLLSKIAGMETLLRLKIPNIKPLNAKAGFSQKFSFAVRKGNAELLAKINDGLFAVKANGRYDALYENWFSVFDPRPVRFRDTFKYLGPAAITLLVIVVVIFVRQYEREKAARRLRQSERELRKAKADLTQTNADLERVVAERTARLQETVAELEHFSYSITHDMRAPLRAMQGFATILNEESADRLSDEHKDYLNRIGSVAGRMDQLITDALNFSKTVRQELVLERVDVVNLLRGILDSYPELQPSRAHIAIQGEIPQVMANVAGLTQSFSNLLGNAVKFVTPGQTPEVRIWAERMTAPDGDAAKNLVTGQKEELPWIRIWIEDNGVGISKAFLPRVFDMFQRESSNHEGTGIGLALVRKVTERMGGKVGVESAPGAGSRFWLIFKAADKSR
jgi:signal transduction histidine kinase